MARISITCPGTAGQGTQIVGPDDIPGNFVLQNTGQCKLKVAMRDSAGAIFSARELAAGATMNYYVDDSAAELIAACWTDCRGTGSVEVTKGTYI